MFVILCLCLAPAVAQNDYIERTHLPYTAGDQVKTHGLYLDAKHSLHIVEFEGWAVIKTRNRERADGGPATVAAPGGEDASVIRKIGEHVLARMKAEVLVPAPPNYVRNPGMRYRVTVEGVDVAPGYTRTFEVDAADALAEIRTDFEMLMSYSYGIETQALDTGYYLAARALSESGRLPAEVPLSILKSKVGQARFQGAFMVRGKQKAADRFKWDHRKRTHVRVMDEEHGAGIRDYETSLEERAAFRGPALEPQRDRATLKRLEEARSPESLMEQVRESQMRGPNERAPRASRPGAPGTPITEPALEIPAVSLQQQESYELLLGPVRSPMETRILGGTQQETRRSGLGAARLGRVPVAR